MTHAALTDPALFFFLAFMSLLLVMFLGAVIVAPTAPPGSPAPVLEVQAMPAVHAPAPLAPLPRRQPRAAAPAAGAGGWPADAGNSASQDAAPMPVYSSVRRPLVSGSP